MEISEQVLQTSEKYILQLRALYVANGYRPYRMSKFEEYDLYAKNKGFLVSDNVITFTDTNGRLLALKPDVTLSIIKNSQDLPQELQKVCYSENVYREDKGTKAFKEIMQTGVECFGKVKDEDVYQVIILAAKSMQLLAADWVLELANVDAVMWQRLAASEFAGHLHLTPVIPVDANYYNGTVFKGYINGVPSAVLSGGQYDRLMEKMHRHSKAIGFAVYVDLLERLEQVQTAVQDDFLNVALPKGRLGEKVYAMFAKAGYECPSILENNRKLFFENEEKKIRYYWVKPNDVAKYVERGAADLGITGLDILTEYEPDVTELLDLKIGICRMMVAGIKGAKMNETSTLRVATKFTNIATKYYRSKGRDIDIIKLHGSIEIAPLLGLSDVIVDIVETGTTLKENNLEELETVLPISARLIANKSACKFKQEKIDLVKKELGNILVNE